MVVGIKPSGVQIAHFPRIWKTFSVDYLMLVCQVHREIGDRVPDCPEMLFLWPEWNGDRLSLSPWGYAILFLVVCSCFKNVSRSSTRFAAVPNAIHPPPALGSDWNGGNSTHSLREVLRCECDWCEIKRS